MEHELDFALNQRNEERLFEPLAKQALKVKVSGEMGCLGLRFTSKVAEKKPVGALGLLMPCCLALPLVGPLLDEKKLPGLRVDKALPKKWAAKCGVKPDWRLMSVNEHRVDTVADLNKVIASVHAAQKRAHDAATDAVKASEDILQQTTWRRKLTLRFVVYKKQGARGMVPMTVQVADERWHEALMYIAPKFPVWMRRFLSYAPEVPDGTRRHFTFDPKDERNQEELTAFYDNIFGDKGDDDAGDGGDGDDEAAAALRLSADKKTEQEKKDAMKSWRVKSITKTDAAGRKVVSQPAEKPSTKEALWEADAEKDLVTFDKFANEALSKTTESAVQAKLRRMSATAKQAMGEGSAASSEEVTIEFEQALVCVKLNPNTPHRLRFNLRAEEQNRQLELRAEDEKAALRNKRSGGGGGSGGGGSDVVEDQDTDSDDDDDKPAAATVTTPHGTVIEMGKELKIANGNELLQCCGLNLIDTRGKLRTTKDTSDPTSPLSRERSRRASNMSADEVCTSVESVTPDTQASRRDVRRGWVLTEASLVGTGLAAVLDGKAGFGAAFEPPHGDEARAQLAVEKDEELHVVDLVECGAPADTALEAHDYTDDMLHDDKVEFKDLSELAQKLYGALRRDICDEVEFGFLLPRGMTFVEGGASSEGWKVADVGQGSEADLKGIKHHWVLVSVEGVSLDVDAAQWSAELEALLTNKEEGDPQSPKTTAGDAATTLRNALWQRLARCAKRSGNDLDLVFRMPKYVPKIRSLTGGVFGESDPLNLENSILSAKQRDRSLTYDEWKDTSFRLLKVDPLVVYIYIYKGKKVGMIVREKTWCAHNVCGVGRKRRNVCHKEAVGCLF